VPGLSPPKSTPMNECYAQRYSLVKITNAVNIENTVFKSFTSYEEEKQAIKPALGQPWV